MSNTVSITGNLTADPVCRFTKTGTAVTEFTLADTPRKKVGDDWVDGTTLFVKCTVWRQQAENVAESLRKGDLVSVTGKLAQENWEAKDGTKRSAVVIDAEQVGAALGRATAKVKRAERSKPILEDDPWGSAPAGDFAPADAEAPF